KKTVAVLLHENADDDNKELEKYKEQSFPSGIELKAVVCQMEKPNIEVTKVKLGAQGLEALKQLPRQEVQLATKFGLTMSEDWQFSARGDPEYVRECCEGSLKRLGVDYIDLYYQHRVDTSVPIEDTMMELKKLVGEGKIKYIGLSEPSPDTIRRAHAVHPITALQMEYSLWSRDIEDEIIPLCRELGIGIVAYSPLGTGFFAGKAMAESFPSENPLSRMYPRFMEGNLDKNKVLYARLANLATKHNCTPPQLALAWLLHQGDDIVPIPGTTKLNNLYNNIGSLAVKLTQEEVKEISDAVDVNEVSGHRAPSFIVKPETRIPRVKLGSQGLEVSRLGLGCASLSGMLGARISHEDGCSFLKEAFDRGVTFFDTSNLYGKDHDNEIMIGKALKQLPRQEVQLATKFGLTMSEDWQFGARGDPEYVRECCEGSLKRLGVDYIDLYYQHRIDTSVPIEDTMMELKKLVDEGKIKYIGLSEASPDTIRRAHAVHPITALQMEYSLWSRDIEDEIIPLCSPLGIGFFAGKAMAESFPSESLLSRMHPRFMEGNLDKNKVLYERLAKLAAKHNCTPPQLALAWLLHQGDDVVPIPGTTKLNNLDNNIGSLSVKLTKEELKEISDAVDVNEVNPEIRIPRVKLGSQGLEVSRLGFGCGGLSGIYNAPLSHESGCAILVEVFSRGITFFDTSDLYGDDHHNEIMIGEALKQLPREKVQLATKFGIKQLEGFQFAVDGTPEYVRQCCEASLKRLGVDYIDLYYQHRVDTSVPIEDTMGELKKLVQEGKAKYVGLSEASVDTIRRAHAIHPITAVQMEYSLWTREIEEDIIPVCRELGISIVAYSPLGRGFFAGKAVVESLPAETLLAMHPRFTGENLEKNKAIYARLDALAAKHSCTPSQLAVAWILHQGDDIVPIPGTTKLKNLDNNIQSLALELTQDDLAEIYNAVPTDEVSGERDYDVFSDYMYKFANTPTK
ncbi:hypothetical protein Tsubulata_019589, partial [Turnera subulata]